MGFTKVSKASLPDNIANLDFGRLNNIQCFSLGDFMGLKNKVMALPGVKERREFLRETCLRDAITTARAQEGYEIIVLGKVSTDKKVQTAVASDVERRTYEIISALLRDNEDKLAKDNSAALEQMVAAATVKISGIAKKAVDEAADNYKPIGVVGLGKVKKVHGVLPPEFERILQLATQRIPIMLVGPAGCGKTYLAEKLGEALGLPTSDQSCSEGMSESVFNGWLLPIGTNGAFMHVASPFMDAYEAGGVMLLDEIDAGDPNLFTYINKAVANSSYTVAQRHKKPKVKKHADFVLVAAANTFGHGADSMYVGRNQLDAATLDRFKVGLIAMDYSHDVEKSLAPLELCEWAWKIRANIRKHKLRRIMSTRVIKDLATMTEAYKWDKPEWESTYFTGWPAGEKAMALQPTGFTP